MNLPANTLVRGIADTKKAEIDSLTDQVSSAEYEVVQLQVVVTSLTAKSNQFNAFLAQADANKTTGLNNLNLAKDTLSSVKSLLTSAASAQTQTNSAAVSVGVASSQISVLINKLIFSVDIIDKLTQLINKQKSINPLIPDDLIKYLTKATTDANTAVATSLIALTSCYAAEATALESQNITDLEFSQIEGLYKKMTIGELQSSTVALNKDTFVYAPVESSTGVMALLHQGYTAAVTAYEKALTANNMVTRQLEHAQANLDSATVQLNSLKAGLAAATAAAYAA